MMVLGLTGMFVGQLLYLLGIYLTNTNMACVFQLAVPVWSTFLAMISGVGASFSHATRSLMDNFRSERNTDLFYVSLIYQLKHQL